MTLESIKKLRSYAMVIEWATDDARNMWTEAVDSVEHEIERDYMKVPVDAEGVPIHVGDVMKLKQCGERIGTVTAVGKHVEARAWVLPDGKNVSVSYIASGIKHVKQRPIEDVLREFILDADCMVCGCVDPEADITPEEIEQAREAWVAKYAAELREMMEVGK